MDRVYQKAVVEATEKELASIRIEEESNDKSVGTPFDEVPARQAGNIILEYEIREDVLYRYYRMRQPDGRNYKKLGIREFRKSCKGLLFFHPEDWDTFEENFCEGGCIPVDVRIREGWGQEYSWYHADFKSFCTGKELEKVRCFLENINKRMTFRDEKEEKLIEELGKDVVNRRFETINLIDVETESCRSFRISKEKWCEVPGKENCFWMKKELLELLNTEHLVKWYIKIGDEDSCRLKRIEYSYFRDDRKQILEVVSDAEEEKLSQDHLKCIIQEKEKEDIVRKALMRSISREIQNSMCVIINTSAMLLAGEISGETAEKLKTIRNISISLKQIVGDVLDFTDITSKGFHIDPSDYRMSFLLLDVFNFIKVQLKNRDVRFFLDLEASVPEYLYGDDTRISQILLNILGNAVEFTSNGFIALKVGGHIQEEDQYCLEFSVKDTGIGMKDEKAAAFMKASNGLDPEDCMGRAQGLGIPISRSLARLMGGDIAIESECGKGSVFHITLLQSMKDKVPVMQTVKKQVNVLLLEQEAMIQKHIVWLLEQMKVGYVVFKDMKEAGNAEGCTHVLLRSQSLLADRKELEARFGREHIILLTEQDELKDITLLRYRQIPLPLLCLHLPKILNSYDNNKKFLPRTRTLNCKYPLQTGSILLVDDSPVNLEMTRSVLEAYLLSVDMADSGEKALELIQKNDYDLVFMDQVMPGMNGSETLSCIRKLGGKYKNIPIIAFTSAVNIGIREEMLHAGFQDYLVKPLEVMEVNRILDTYIHSKNRNEKITEEKIMELDYPSLVLMGKLRSACRTMEYDCAEEIVREMLRYTYPQEITEHLNAMLESCEEFAYDEFDKMADVLLMVIETDWGERLV